MSSAWDRYCAAFTEFWQTQHSTIRWGTDSDFDFDFAYLGAERFAPSAPYRVHLRGDEPNESGRGVQMVHGLDLLLPRAREKALDVQPMHNALASVAWGDTPKPWFSDLILRDEVPGLIFYLRPRPDTLYIAHRIPAWMGVGHQVFRERYLRFGDSHKLLRRCESHFLEVCIREVDALTQTWALGGPDAMSEVLRHME